jgi:hypothetical protein
MEAEVHQTVIRESNEIFVEVAIPIDYHKKNLLKYLRVDISQNVSPL